MWFSFSYSEVKGHLAVTDSAGSLHDLYNHAEKDLLCLHCKKLFSPPPMAISIDPVWTCYLIKRQKIQDLELYARSHVGGHKRSSTVRLPKLHVGTGNDLNWLIAFFVRLWDLTRSDNNTIHAWMTKSDTTCTRTPTMNNTLNNNLCDTKSTQTDRSVGPAAQGGYSPAKPSWSEQHLQTKTGSMGKWCHLLLVLLGERWTGYSDLWGWVWGRPHKRWGATQSPLSCKSVHCLSTIWVFMLVAREGWTVIPWVYWHGF